MLCTWGVSCGHTRRFAYSFAGTVGIDDIVVSIVNSTKARTEIDGDDDSTMKERFDEGTVTELGSLASF